MSKTVFTGLQRFLGRHRVSDSAILEFYVFPHANGWIISSKLGVPVSYYLYLKSTKSMPTLELSHHQITLFKSEDQAKRYFNKWLSLQYLGTNKQAAS